MNIESGQTPKDIGVLQAEVHADYKNAVIPSPIVPVPASASSAVSSG